jgi:ABC-2 type transport system ATP-binding protein
MNLPHRVEIRGLTKRFGTVEAVTGLTFTAEPGRVTGFLGPNGSGKTTTLRMLLDLVQPTSGTALIGGRRYRDLATPAGTVGAVLDASHFHPARSGRDHLRVYADMLDSPRSRVEQLVTQLDLGAFVDRKARDYSTGMRQRLNLATSLLGDPSVLLLDEPGNGLDPESNALLRRMLRRLAAEGRTVLVSSHVLSETEQLVDDVVIIRRGRLLTTGTLADVTAGTSLEQRFLHLTGALT